MAIATMDELVAGMAAGQQMGFHKVSLANSTSGLPMSLWTAAGSPGAGSTPASGAGVAPTNATGGCLAFTDPGGADSAYLTAIELAGSTAGQWSLIDRLVHTSGLDGTVTTSQTVNSAAITRPDATGEGVELFVECYTQLGASNRTLTVTYTNQAGTGSRTGTALIPPNMRVGGMSAVALQAGDTGVRSVQSVILSASTGTAGNFGMTLLRRVATLAANNAAQGVQHDVFDLGMPNINSGACLAFMMYAAATSTGTMQGLLRTATG